MLTTRPDVSQVDLLKFDPFHDDWKCWPADADSDGAANINTGQPCVILAAPLLAAADPEEGGRDSEEGLSVAAGLGVGNLKPPCLWEFGSW